jgi:hypothetical protein
MAQVVLSSDAISAYAGYRSPGESKRRGICNWRKGGLSCSAGWSPAFVFARVFAATLLVWLLMGDALRAARCGKP